MSLKYPSTELQGQTEAEFLANAPILATLKARLEVSRTRHDWAIALAQQALYLVRTDRIAEATPVPNEIRAHFRGHEEPEVFYWVWLLEAVLDFYRTGETAGMQKIQRAMLMAKALKRQDLEEYLAAWAAHFCFTDGQYESMVRWLKISNLHEAKLPEAACRASLVAAVAWQTCGNDGPAIKWFGRAREIARKLGDRATIMASIANRGAIRLNDIWMDHFLVREDNSGLSEVSNELLGALGYEYITGTVALRPQAHIFRMRVAYLHSDLTSTIIHIGNITSSIGHDSYSILEATNIFSIWLRVVRLREVVSTYMEADRSELAIHSMDKDDAAVSWRMLSDIAKVQGDLAMQSRCADLSRAALESYSSDRELLRNLLNDFT